MVWIYPGFRHRDRYLGGTGGEISRGRRVHLSEVPLRREGGIVWGGGAACDGIMLHEGELPAASQRLHDGVGGLRPDFKNISMQNGDGPLDRRSGGF